MSKAGDWLNELIKAYISSKRLEEFFFMDEIDPPTVVQDKENAIKIKGSFTWDKDLPKPTLPGSLILCLGLIH
jgi:hypothetical protein